MDSAKTLPSSEDLLRAFGLRPRRSSGDALPGLALFGVGMLVGAGLALLFAPLSADEIRSRAQRIKDDLTEAMGAGAREDDSDGAATDD